jgi:hypothetical protein
VIVHDLNVLRAIHRPTKYDPPLVIDPDRMLPAPITLERLETISRWGCQIPDVGSVVQQDQLSAGNCDQVRRKASWLTPVDKNRLSPMAAEAPDHVSIVS